MHRILALLSRLHARHWPLDPTQRALALHATGQGLTEAQRRLLIDRGLAWVDGHGGLHLYYE